MSRHRSVIFGLLIVGGILCSRMLVISAEPEEPRSYATGSGNTGFVSAPVTYKNIMLIAVTPEGVAAVVFDETVGRGVKYRFRCLQNGWTDEIVGEGTVFEKYTDGKYAGGKLTITAGPIRIGWSAGGDAGGWVYYEPEKLRLQIASGDRFEDENKELGDRVVRHEKLDLKRFLKQP
ncbi:MAG: hypothetical protein WEB58_19320 [Planctomycetaceae bacterium]